MRKGAGTRVAFHGFYFPTKYRAFVQKKKHTIVRGILMALHTDLCTARCNELEGLEKMQVEHSERQ